MQELVNKLNGAYVLLAATLLFWVVLKRKLF